MFRVEFKGPSVIVVLRVRFLLACLHRFPYSREFMFPVLSFRKALSTYVSI